MFLKEHNGIHASKYMTDLFGMSYVPQAHGSCYVYINKGRMNTRNRASVTGVEPIGAQNHILFQTHPSINFLNPPICHSGLQGA